MRNKLTQTVVGWVASAPKLYTKPDGPDFCSFRLASTPQYFDRENAEWVSGRTEWFTVKTFRSLAQNVATSIRKSDPVVVAGRLYTEDWGDEQERTNLVIDAHSVGHDLALGVSNFRRQERVPANSTNAADTDGLDDLDQLAPRAQTTGQSADTESSAAVF